MASHFGASERAMVKIADQTSPSIFKNIYNENHENAPAPVASSGSRTNRHRVGASPVRVKRSIKDVVPTAVVTPTPPYGVSTVTQPQNSSTSKTNYENRYICFSGVHTRFSPTPSEFITANVAMCGGAAISPMLGMTPAGGSSSSLSRRSRSSFGGIGLGLLARKLDYDDSDEKKPLQRQQQEKSQRNGWLGDGLDAENQAASNSILTLHLSGDNRQGNPARDESQERRLSELEARLREIETRLAANKSVDAAGHGSSTKNELNKTAASEAVQSPKEARIKPTQSRPNSATKSGSDYGVVSVAVPPLIALDGGVFRVQPTAGSEIKVKRDIERLEKKLKHQEELAETLRTQHYKQIEQLTRQLASNDDVIQTLRSRIRELELENELWQNRFRLYNDVDVAKILRENERLRSAQRRRGDREQQQETEKKEQAEEELAKLHSRYAELESKYRSVKGKYKDAINAYRTRRRQDHIELESLKVTVQLQNSELSDLRKQLFNHTNASSSTSSAATNGEFTQYNLKKCANIVDCLSNICTHIKLHESVDPEEVLDYDAAGGAAGKKERDQKSSAEADVDESLDGSIEQLASKLMHLHTLVVDLYGDDLANAVTCNVQ